MVHVPASWQVHVAALPRVPFPCLVGRSAIGQAVSDAARHRPAAWRTSLSAATFLQVDVDRW